MDKLKITIFSCIASSVFCAQAFASSNSSAEFAGDEIARESVNLTYQVLKMEATVGEAIESLAKSGELTSNEVQRIKEFAEAKQALRAPIVISTEAQSRGFRVGNISLTLKKNGDLATGDGRLLGLTDDLALAETFERSFSRLFEKKSYSFFNLIFEAVHAEEATGLAAVTDSIAAAYTAMIFKKNVYLSQERAKIMGKTYCMAHLKVFIEASELDQKRKEAYGPKSGKYECDKASPFGVRRYRDSLEDVAARDADRKLRSDELKRKFSDLSKGNLKTCIDSLTKLQQAEIVEAAALYDDGKSTEQSIRAFTKGSPNDFVCSADAIRRLENFERGSAVAKLVSYQTWKSFGSLCGQTKVADASFACEGSATLERPQNSKKLQPNRKGGAPAAVVQ